MDWQQYQIIQETADIAQERLLTGEGRSGVHYELIHLLGTVGVFCFSREEAIKKANKICREFLESEGQ